jgi:hypothetical protein
MIKHIFLPALDRHVRLGRLRPAVRCPRLSLGNYLLRQLPLPPASCDYTAAAARTLADIYGNDQLGDCVIAGGEHVRGVTSANAGSETAFSLAQTVAQYSAIGGYVPGNPATDQGCDEQTALNYWVQHGFADGVRLTGWLAIDASNIQECQTALWLFENLYFGIELPDAWVGAQMPQASGFVWDVAGAPDPSNGHCVAGFGYDSRGVTIDTWGMLGTMTWAAVQAYAGRAAGGELYVLLSPDLIGRAQTKAPNGFNWSQLVADFDALGGHVPLPAPTPTPTPIPPPGPAPVPPQPQPLFDFTLNHPIHAGGSLTLRGLPALAAGTYEVRAAPATGHAEALVQVAA